MWWLILLSVAVTLTVVLLTLQNERKKSFFESNQIKYLGNGLVRIIRNFPNPPNFQDDMLAQYLKVKASGKKLGASTDFGMTLLVIDPDLIKCVMVKDFDHFTNRRKFFTGEADTLFGKMLVTVEGEKWKQLRSKMSPTFTTGKIKRMFKLFDQSGQKFIKFLKTELERVGNDNEELELGKGYSKFTMDVIATVVCGVNSEAFNQREPSLFERMGQGLQFQLNLHTIFKMLAMAWVPAKVGDLVGLSLFRKDVQAFFSGAIKGVIKQRETTGQKGNDFVQLLLEARAGTLKSDESDLQEASLQNVILEDSVEKESQSSNLLDDDGIVANCVLFMLAGFDTTQSLLIFCSYALALHEDIQTWLRLEVDQILETNDGQLTYDGISNMPYLDMVINETLRLYPPSPQTDRCCTKDYTFPETNYVLKEGGTLVFPINGLHHDPEFFPEPEKFDPERFSRKNKGNVNPYAFFPFGHGPRNCIGMRFALIEAKVVLSYLVHHFKLEPSEKTMIPMKFSNSSTLKPEGGLYLRLRKIQH